ncbi:MAG: hypothetical protein ACTSUE_14080 [Promethearchaeota archaeon]
MKQFLNTTRPPRDVDYWGPGPGLGDNLGVGDDNSSGFGGGGGQWSIASMDL